MLQNKANCGWPAITKGPQNMKKRRTKRRRKERAKK